MATIMQGPGATKTVSLNRMDAVRETDQHYLVKVRKATRRSYKGLVYNLKVSGEESYTANGFAVHNCHRAKTEFGYKVLLDTGLRCRHVGGSQADYGSMLPLETLANT